MGKKRLTEDEGNMGQDVGCEPKNKWLGRGRVVGFMGKGEYRMYDMVFCKSIWLDRRRY